MADLDTPVWYAAFGSNLSSARFATYLGGGPVPLATTERVQRGARDPSPPRGDHPYLIHRELVFAGRSTAWGDGGVAFLDADVLAPETPTMGRIWGITLGQFTDVFAQENRLDAERSEVSIDLPTVVDNGRADLIDRSYGRVELLEVLDGVPVLTITGRSRPTELRPAHASYLATIAAGLAETWGADAASAARYLAALVPHRGSVDPARLESILRRT